VAFTNGVFDLIHPGHVDILNAARDSADALVVGVNSDESVRRLKGPTRPVRSDAERAYVVAAIECVDLVVIFPEDTPLNLVKHLRPDVIVKGGDYAEETIVGAAEVRSWGGRVVVVPLTPGHSTTAIIRKLNEDA
jgi:D-beta-D-heptose 7-phosphate kinase/D-beta-D-heptose 1-phosphate adenosyltransferase